MTDKTEFTAKELMETDFGPEPPESAYRRGYADGFVVALNYLADGLSPEDLFNFWQTLLMDWKSKDLDREVLPPEPGKAAPHETHP